MALFFSVQIKVEYANKETKRQKKSEGADEGYRKVYAEDDNPELLSYHLLCEDLARELICPKYVSPLAFADGLVSTP